MPEVDLVVFDLGNVLTIVDEGPPTRKLARLSGRSEGEVTEACYTRQRKAPLETGRQSWDEFLEQTRLLLGFDISEPEFRSIFASSVTPDPRMLELAGTVAAQIRAGLCSNTHEVHHELVSNEIPVAALMDPVVVSYEVGAMKPDPAIFRAVVERSGLPPGRILFIDDLPENIRGAERLGIKGVVFQDRQQLEHDLSAYGIVL